jgi:hypothetical protein
MRKFAMMFAIALTFAIASFNATVAYAEPPDPCFFDDGFEFFLNPQPLPPG